MKNKRKIIFIFTLLMISLVGTSWFYNPKKEYDVKSVWIYNSEDFPIMRYENCKVIFDDKFRIVFKTSAHKDMIFVVVKDGCTVKINRE
jgi:hypothetical protein